MKIHFNSTELEVQENESSYRYRALMEKPQLVLKFSLPRFVEIPVGAWCEFQGEKYSLNSPENIKKNGTRNIEYTLALGTAQDNLGYYKMRDPVDHRLKFSMTGKPGDFLDAIVRNLNDRDGSGWNMGECIDAAEKTIEFNHAYIDAALQDVANAFETEWEINGGVISLHKVEYFKEAPLPLSYGKGNGFVPGVGRATRDDELPIKRLYVQGGERNIDPSKYKSKELLLPKLQKLVYEGRTYRADEDGYYIERIDKVSDAVKEDSLDCSEIYPSRVGEVTEVVTEDGKDSDGKPFTFHDFIDNTIPDTLNYNDCRIDGETATVVFQSGMLAGKEFEIEQTDKALTGYDHKTRRFKLVPQEIDGVMMPGGVYVPKVGDKYAVFGINLPQAYICDNDTQTGASWDMFKEAARKLYENEDPKFTFTGTLQGLWAKRNWVNVGGKLKVGGYILFSDEQFARDGIAIRITGIKDYISSPYTPQLEISNSVSGKSLSSKLREIEKNEVKTEDGIRDAVNYTKRRWRDARETVGMLQDAWQTNFSHFSGSVNPLTVETMMMLVGDESLQFRFVRSKTDLTPVGDIISYNNETKQLHVPHTFIQHMTLGISNISSSHANNEYKVWEMEEFQSAYLDHPEKKYYLYAKVSREDTEAKGTFLLSEQPIGMTETDGHYHLLVGVLNSEYDGERSFVTLYGFTEILPGRITTDKIVSSDGTTYFDLLRGIISGRIKFTSGSSGLYELDEWEAVNGLITQAQNTANAAVESAKNANTAVGDLNDYVDGAFADGIITEAEAKAIEKYINTVNNTKAAVEAAYNKLYTNAYLTGTAKTGLLNAKVTLMGSIENLISAINSAIADGRTTVTEKNNVDNKYATFNSAYADFNTAVEAANKAIQDTLKGYSDSVLNTANAAVESAKNAIAKDLGYANFDDLAKKAAANETIIVGGKINTTLIDAELIVTAALLAKVVKVTELVAEHLTVTGSSKIAGFSVSGNGLTNTPFNNDAYVIFRNDAHKCFAGIGGNVLPASSGLRAVARFENEDTSDWWGLNRNIATLFSAKNGRYNHAFLGSGNGNLDGWIGGYRYSKYNLTSANIIYSGYSNLKDNNRWVIYSSVNNSGITLPKLSEVRDALGIGSRTNFCVEFTIISDLDSKDFYIYGRNGKESSDSTYPWNTDEYPNLVHWNNDHWDSVTMGPGDSLTVLLIYDSAKSGNKGGYPLTYTARIINRQN